jgi:endonuclease/exonuclease/phosphatase family metal-dependent hydrolase
MLKHTHIPKKHYWIFVSLLTFCGMTFSACSYNRYSRNYTNPDFPRYAGLGIAQESRPANGSLKVVTYNIKCSEQIGEALKIIKGNEKLADADIICLQEMDLKGVKTIAQKLQYNYVYYPAIVYKNKDFGPAILSKWPILYDEKIILPHLNHNKSQKCITSAVIDYQGKKVKIFSVHLGVLLYPNQRGDQIDKIVQELNPNIDYFIVAGDFNTLTQVNLRTVVEPLIEQYFTFVTRDIEWTYKHWYFFNKKASLDHILTQGMKVVDVGIVPDRSASDHIPVWAELKLLKR